MTTTAGSTPIHYLTAGETAARIREGSLTSVEAVRACVERIRALNPRLNAVVDLHDAEALVRAQAADAALARGEDWGPLHGVPVTVKDVYDVAGMRITFGWPPMRRNVPRADAFAVERIRGAGAVVLGITNAPLGSYDWQCWNPLHGRTNNPWDARRTPGGSSGGSCAAIAAGFSALELGSDAAGSIRVPTHFCGVMGMKPTETRVSGRGHGRFPGIPYSLRHICTYGPIARSVDDLEMAMRLLVAPDPAFPDAPPVPFRPAPPRDAATLRIAWTDAFGGYPVSAATSAALRGVAAKLEAAGAAVERRAPEAIDGDDALRTWGEINGFETGVALPAYASVPMRFGAAVQFGRGPFSQGLRKGFAFNAKRYFFALDRRDRHCGAFEAFMGGWDAWLCPVAAVSAITHRRTGAAVEVDGRKTSYSLALGAWASMVAMLGAPAVVLPAGRSDEGLPIGIQVVGRRWDDAGVLAVARVIEHLTGGFHPPPALDQH
ncbi:amidase [Longimicrobium sp.]|uniref:amidase n=1 Tax=Longimicrobium sp. TaxID=2029185 RepID=UPI002B92E536|nr:amidase family protein [Longimicrobium sp.]HSU17547.1 amidase family protein [Longimicrobium sp.]